MIGAGNDTWMIILSCISMAAGYLLGSINTSLIVGKLYGIDIREHGSGNAGMTNTLRTVGRKAALVVLAGDALKSVISCLAGLILAGEYGAIAGGLGAVAGHNWPVYFKFKGGKGVLTSFTAVLFLDWRIGLILLAVFAIVLLISRYVSLSSICAAAFFPVSATLLGRGAVFVVFSLIIALLIILRHQSNIGRLLNRTESRLGAKH